MKKIEVIVQISKFSDIRARLDQINKYFLFRKNLLEEDNILLYRYQLRQQIFNEDQISRIDYSLLVN